ncbi:recombinase family protein [Rhizobium skierniewicense]|uniref:recombinase family protein n=1 Tax=Rhizobium skierniewicense TaxID=984260 RepID=UPI001FADD8F0|nr:recombinase family protein [Rhizobium skierniewicense]
MAHVKREHIDVVLFATVDRLSRDMEHSAKILKELRYRDVDLWTVHAGTPVTDLELAMRAALSHEMVENIRYRTRESMKTAVRKSKARRACPKATSSPSSAMPMVTASGAFATLTRPRPRSCGGSSKTMSMASHRQPSHRS